MGNLSKIQRKLDKANELIVNSYSLLDSTRIAIKNQMSNKNLSEYSTREIMVEFNKRLSEHLNR